MIRNFEKVEERVEIYLDHKIIAWKDTWEEYNEKKEKFEKRSKIWCQLVSGKYSFLNLGECNDGGKFTAVNQAVNQAKELINVCNGKENWLKNNNL